MTFSIPDFSSCKVLVAGDLMLDRYWFGPTRRISPEAPVPVVNVQEHEDRAGGAANVAVNLARLGVKTRLVGITGPDEAGAGLAKVLTDAGVKWRFIESEQPTVVKLRVLSRNQQLIRLDTESAEPAAVSILKQYERALDKSSVVLLSDYAKGTLHEIESLIALARDANKPVLVDPKGADFRRYRGASVVTPNLAEFEAVVGSCADDDVLVKRAGKLCADLDLGGVLVTRSAAGMMLVERNGNATHLAAEAREVYDVTGAGDTVISTLAASLAAGLDLPQAAALANIAAGLVVAKLGVATVSRSELRLALHRKGIGGRGQLGESQLVEFVREAQERGERVVMTNGCFDLLHAGHIAYLEEAKALGNRLVVAVNDDDSVRRLKGAGRPITPFADRAAVLAGLAAVDWVIPFSDDTPEALIKAVHPNILVKGGDYKPDEIAGGSWLTEHGGEVRVLAFRPGRSTSAIIERIRNAQ